MFLRKSELKEDTSELQSIDFNFVVKGTLYSIKQVV